MRFNRGRTRVLVFDPILFMNEITISGRILFVGAHCDDIEIGCGGTAAKCADSGCTIGFAVATFDTKSKLRKVRKAEAITAGALVGVSEKNKNLFFGSFIPGKLTQNEEGVRTWLKNVLAEFKPDTVFIHQSDHHTDHQAIHKVGIGVFQSINIFLYYIPRPFPETPYNFNYAEDISEVINKKLEMCACHVSQPGDYISEDAVRTSGHYWYWRTFARLAKRTDGFAEPFIIHALRSPLGKKPVYATVSYDLRLVRKKDGTLVWED